MRTSLLLQREPFGDILRNTLGRYWAARMGCDYDVQWHARTPRRNELSRAGRQGWFGNIYLNFFATPGTLAETFEVLRREYGSSSQWWRRIPQAAYVNLACHPAFMPRLAHVAFSLAPAAPEGGASLVLGGNRRLRFLHPQAGLSTVVLKHGFPSQYLAAEVELRRALNLRAAPRLKAASVEQGWYDEEYTPGTPTNRLPAAAAILVDDEAHAALAEDLVTPTLRMTDSAGHLHDCLARAGQLVHGAQVATAVRQQVAKVDSAARRAFLRHGGPAEIPTAMSHGDFQAANVLATKGGTRVIDWECVARRFTGYDALVHATGSRTGRGLPQRVRALFEGMEPAAQRRLGCWPGLTWKLPDRRRALAAFLVEELVWILEENCSVELVQPAPGLFSQVAEIGASFAVLD